MICLLCGLMIVLAPAPVRGVDSVELAIDALAGEGWQVDTLRVVLRPGEEHHGLELQADTLRLGEEFELRAVHAECAAMRLRGLGGDCPDGRIRFEHPWLGAQTLPARFSYAHPGRLDLQLEGLLLAGGPVDVHVKMDDGQWELDARGEGLDLQALAALSADAGWPWPVTASGDGRLTFAARGRGALPDTLDLDLSVGDTAFSSEDGLRAGEAVDADLAVAVAREDGGYRVELTGRWTGGGVYLHPVYVEADVPVRLSMQGSMDLAARVLTVDGFELDHPGVLGIAGRGTWAIDRGLSGLEATVQLDRMDLPAAYELFGQPFLPGTALGVLDTEGLLAGGLRLHEGSLQEVVLNASRVTAHDRMGRFAVQGLDAALHWRAAGDAPLSRVSMDGGHVYGIALGASRFRPVIGRDGFHLPEPVHLPVLDGALEIRDLRVAGLDGGDARWQFDGGLTPVSMEQLTAALGWPELSGTLAGIIPEVRYEQGLLTVGGRLLVRAFDGSVTLGELRLRDPLGVAPEFSAQIQIRDIDLAQLTRTFDFGRITGRLEGDVRDLVLVRWAPVQFDAELRTPPGDTSTRRISQRAVDNLTQVGGGVGGVLSGGFLRFFEDFGYRRLGLSCRLVGEVCHMDGVAPAAQGYYIVQGAGLPRIDVIGFTRQVAWRDLVARLAVIIQDSGGPEVR
ncbi:AsmA family protein [Thioalkalivibrio thiocyanodenitrificans]|uniref:hypothetical protein n=1 Tax=Thioalkalivibrio thiocyanodenitrificans TaxID=243063 RepID=UPI0003656EDA|nr:hypothetical protein [Thioalkalivibrio thiocyanodenitrificans]